MANADGSDGVGIVAFVLWTLASCVAILSIHGSIPTSGWMTQWAIIDPPQPDGLLDILVGLLGGLYTFLLYAFSRGSPYYSLVVGVALGAVVALGVIGLANPAFGILVRTTLVGVALITSVLAVAIFTDADDTEERSQPTAT